MVWGTGDCVAFHCDIACDIKKIKTIRIGGRAFCKIELAVLDCETFGSLISATGMVLDCYCRRYQIGEHAIFHNKILCADGILRYNGTSIKMDSIDCQILK